MLQRSFLIGKRSNNIKMSSLEVLPPPRPRPRASHLRARGVPLVGDTRLPQVIPLLVTGGANARERGNPKVSSIHNQVDTTKRFDHKGHVRPKFLGLLAGGAPLELRAGAEGSATCTLSAATGEATTSSSASFGPNAGHPLHFAGPHRLPVTAPCKREFRLQLVIREHHEAHLAFDAEHLAGPVVHRVFTVGTGYRVGDLCPISW